MIIIIFTTEIKINIILVYNIDKCLHVSISSLSDKSAIEYYYRIYYYIVHINKLISVDIYTFIILVQLLYISLFNVNL